MKINGIVINQFSEEKIHSLYPDCWMIEPQGIWQLPKNKQDRRSIVCESGEYFAQEKKDGFFYSFEKRNGKGYLFGRKKSVSTGLFLEKIENVPHIEKVLLELFPNDTVILGEIYLPGGRSNDVTKIMNCKSPKAIQRQKDNGYLWFYIHDCLSLDGENLLDINNFDRYNILLKYWLWNCIAENTSYITMANSCLQNIDNQINSIISSGGEGMVLKRKAGKFISGKKTAWETIKFKKEDYYDIIITSFNPATKIYTGDELDTWPYWEDVTTKKITENRPEYPNFYVPVTKGYKNGWIGSFNIGVYKDGNIIDFGSVSSGLTDELCEQIKQNPSNFINRPIMIRAMDIEKDNRFRHPVFIDFRDDLNIEDCSYNKLFGE